MPMDITMLRMKVADLGQAVEKKMPHYASILNTIHQELKATPELNYMLGDDEIAILIGGLAHYHKVEITEPKSKKPVTKKQGNLLSADDI